MDNTYEKCLRTTAQTMSSKTNLSILTLNVRGLKSTTKRTTVFQWLLAQNVYIIILQETYFTKCNKYKIMKQWNGKSIHGHSNSLFSKGVSILLKPGLDVKVENELFVTMAENVLQM